MFGVIKVNSLLSYDRKREYSLSVAAVDTSGKSSQCVVKVTVTDKNRHRPTFTQQEFTFNISEDKPVGALVGRITVSYHYQ